MTPWEILGISQDADKRDIKRAYGKLIKENRPDDSPEQFQLIRSAYEYMLDSLSDSSAPTPHFSSIMSAAVSPTKTTTENELPQSPTKTPTKQTRPSGSQDAALTEAANQAPSDDLADQDSDGNRDIAVQANAFIGSFTSLIANFPDNGKLTTRDMELCRLETVTLMRNEVLNHWHAREHLSDCVFNLLCENIAISTGLWSTTTNFPAQFLQYLDEQFLWTENEVALCELCEDDSAGLVFHVIHDGRNNGAPNWSELPEPSGNDVTPKPQSEQSLVQKIRTLFTPP